MLKLTPELQSTIGQESIKLLRAVGNKPPEQQAAALEELKQQQIDKDARKTPKQPAPPADDAAEPSGHYPVIAPAPTVAVAQPCTERSDEARSLPTQTPPKAPAEQSEDRQLKRFPYDDGVSAAQYLIHKMPPEEFDKMLSLLIKHKDSQASASR